MVTYIFNKQLPLFFNMNISIGHHSWSFTYTNRFSHLIPLHAWHTMQPLQEHILNQL